MAFLGAGEQEDCLTQVEKKPGEVGGKLLAPEKFIQKFYVWRGERLSGYTVIWYEDKQATQ